MSINRQPNKEVILHNIYVCVCMCVYIMEMWIYIMTNKKNKILPFGTWMDLEDIILSEISYDSPYLWDLKNKTDKQQQHQKIGPGHCGSVGWASAHKRKKGHWFNSQSGHMLRLWARSAAGGLWEAADAADGWLSLTSVFLSLSFSLPSPLSNNK